MRRRQLVSDIGEKNCQFGGDTALRIGRAHAVQVFGAALLHHGQACPQIRRQRGDRSRNDIAEHPRAKRSTQHQQTHRANGWGVTQRRKRNDRLAHRIAGQQRRNAVRQALGGGKAERQHRCVARQEPIGAAQHGVLLVQHHGWTATQRSRRQHGRDRRIAAKRNDRSGVQPRQDAASLHRTACEGHQRRSAAQHPAPGDASTGDNETLVPREHRTAQPRRARVAQQHDAPPPRHQLAGQRLGRKKVPPGAPSNNNDA